MADSGRDCVWDFSKNRFFGEMQSLVCHSTVQQDTTQFTKHWLHSRHNYQTIGDTLYCTGYENANMRVTYTNKEKILVFPFGYADMLHSAFCGKGEYAHRDTFSIQGEATTICDGVGKLLLPDNEVIDSVLRLHIKRLCWQKGEDTVKTQWDVYQWYSAQERYPIIENACCKSICANDSTNLTYAFYCPQKEYQTKHSKETEQALTLQTEPQWITDIGTQPNPVRDNLYLNYTLQRDAIVSYSLHYNGGACMYRSDGKKQNAGEYRHSIDMGKYPTGTYVLYIYADDQVVSKNILKL